MKALEKTPLASKKFIAYLISNLSSKMLLFWMVGKDTGDIITVSMIIASMFIDIGYILGQAALDKYVRVASLSISEDIKIL